MSASLPDFPPVSARRLKEIAQLHRRKKRVESGQFMLEGLRTLEAAADANADLVDIFVDPQRTNDARTRSLIKRVDARVYSISSRDMSRVADTSTAPGILGVARMPEPSTDCLMCKGRVLVLDGIQDPGNVGTLIRTAAWFGISAVVAGPGTSDFYHPKTVRATMGGLWDVQLESVESLEGFLGTCKRNDMTIWAADMAGVAATEWDAGKDSILIIGSEANGIRDSVRQLADSAVTIPGSNSQAVESLNAAVAGAILMSRW